MPKAAIAIDSWKLPIFERRLSQAGYSFTKADWMQGTLMLSITTDNLQALSGVVEAANTEAAQTGAQPMALATDATDAARWRWVRDHWDTVGGVSFPRDGFRPSWAAPTDADKLTAYVDEQRAAVLPDGEPPKGGA